MEPAHQPILLVARDEDDAARLKHRLRKWSFDEGNIAVVFDREAMERWLSIYHGVVIDGDAGVDEVIDMEMLKLVNSVFEMAQSIDVIRTVQAELRCVITRSTETQAKLVKFAVRANADLYGGKDKTGALQAIKTMSKEMSEYRSNHAKIIKMLDAGSRKMIRYDVYAAVGVMALGAAAWAFIYLLDLFHASAE